MNKDKVVADNIDLVKSIAAKYSSISIPFEDLVQEGMIGLLKAADNYKKDKGAKFSTYATYWIKKYILAALEHESKTSISTTELNEEKTEAKAAEDKPQKITLPQNMPKNEKAVLTLLFENEFTLNEIADKLKISRERVRQYKEKGLRRLRAKTE